MVSINRISPQGLEALLTVLTTPDTPDFEDGTLKAMLLTTATTLTTEDKWNSVATLDVGGYTLSEYVTGSTTIARVAVTVASLATSAGKVQITFNNIIWTSLASPDGDEEVTHVLIYMEKDGAVADALSALDLRVPVAVFDASFTADGTSFTAVMPSPTLEFDT